MSDGQVWKKEIQVKSLVPQIILEVWIFFAVCAVGATAEPRTNDIIYPRSVQIEECATENVKKFSPVWSDLDTRVAPEWYDKAKIGIFIHWGVYSVPSYSSEWFWKSWLDRNNTAIKKFMEKNYKPGFSYQEFAPMFTAEFFDPDIWAKLFAEAGARYVVLTTKHHEGFTLFPSKHSFSWNAVEVGPKRDLVHDISEAVRKQGLKFGAYHSLYEWYNPMYLSDKENNFKTQNFVDTKLWPDIKQLIETYKPSVLWADGDWEAEDTYWKATKLIAWLYNDSPVKDEILVNDRWGYGTACKHGDFYNCADRYNPKVLQSHKWENAFTIDKESWGFQRNLSLKEIMSDKEIIEEVVTAVSCGGNALINVGPTKEGTIPLIFQERLLSLGHWLKTNGEAIYGTSPWLHQNDTINGDVWYTCRKVKTTDAETLITNEEIIAIYAILLEWPRGSLKLKDVTTVLHSEVCDVHMLDDEFKQPLKWIIQNGVTIIQIPQLFSLSSKSAWVLKISLRNTR